MPVHGDVRDGPGSLSDEEEEEERLTSAKRLLSDLVALVEMRRPAGREAAMVG